MRPKTLTIKGINNITDKQIIDFTSLLESGIFGIFGPTGSGKSTILDSIIIALYGTGSIPRGSRNFINSDMDKALIEFQFDIVIGGEECLVTVARSFKTNKSTQGVLTDKIRFTIEKNGEVDEILDKTQEVDKRIVDIIGLKSEDFVKSVVLPQGKFSEFLRLSGKSRRDMLERILNLEKYGSNLQEKVRQKRRNLEKELEIIQGKLDVLGDRSQEELDNLYNQLSELESDINNKKKSLLALEKEIESMKKRNQILEELNNIEIEIKEYEDNINYWDEIKSKLELSKRSSEAIVIREQIEIKTKHMKKQEDEKKEKEIVYQGMKIELNELECEYRKIIQEKKNNIPEKRLLLEKIKTINVLKDKINKNNTIINEKMEEMNRKKSQQETISASITEVENLKGEIYRKSSVLSQEINGMNVDIELREGLKVIVDLERSLKIIDENVIALKNEIKTIENQYKASENKLNNALSSIKNCEERKKEILRSIDKNTEIIEKTKKEISKEILIERELNDNNNELILLNDKIDKAKTLIEELTIKENEYKSDILKLESDVKERINMYGSLVRDMLHKGDICPVCNGIVGSQDELGEVNISEESFHLLAEKKGFLNQTSYEKVHNEDVLMQSIDKKEKLEKRLREIDKEIEVIKKSKSNLENFTKEFEEDRKLIVNIEEEIRSWELIIYELKTDVRLFQERKDIKEKVLSDSIRNMSDIRERITSLNLTVENPENELSNLIEKEKVLVSKRKEKESLDKSLREISEEYQRLSMENISVSKDIDTIHEHIFQLQLKNSENIIFIGEDYYNADTVEIFGELSKYINEFEDKEISIQENLENKREKFNDIELQYENLKQSISDSVEEISNLSSKLTIIIKDKELPEDYYDRSYDKDTYDNVSKDYYLNFEKYRNNLSKKENQILKLDYYKDLDGTLEEKILQKTQCEREYEKIIADMGNLKSQARDYSEKLSQVKEILNTKKKVDKDNGDYKIIQDLVKGNKFVDYISKGELEYILRDASSRLMKLTSNRYSISMDMNGNFIINDYYNGGISRDINSLSGGESFITSLSMALALSSKIQMKSKSNIDFFFLDEGFGTLDKETLEIVLSSLEKLKLEDLSVGIISHVEEIKNRINSKIILDKINGVTNIKMLVG